MSTQLYAGGPAYAVRNGITLKMRKDWNVTNPDQFFAIPSNTGVGVSKGIKDKMGKASFTPKVLVSGLGAMLSEFFPYTAETQCGTQVAPSSDLPLVIHAKNGGTSNLGLSLTYPKSFLSKMPKLTFAHDKPLISAVEYTLLVATGANVGDVASFVTKANATYTEPNWSIADEYFDRYTFGLGFLGTKAANTNTSTALTGLASTAGIIVGQGISGTGIPANTTVEAIVSATALTLSAAATGTASITATFTQLAVIVDKDGIEFEPVADLEMIQPASQPTQDAKIKAIKGTLRFRPLNMDADTFYAYYFPEETNQALGASVEATGYQANITGAKTGGAGVGGVNLVIPCVARSKSGLDFSTSNPRMEKVELEAISYNTGSVWSNLFTLAVNA